MLLKRIRKILYAIAGIALLCCGVIYALWNSRADIDEISWPEPTVTSTIGSDAVTATWLGVTSLLFDDGETQLLIDGFFSRPSVLDIVLDRPIESDAAQVNFAMNEFRMRRLAAIIPLHSHFDHALDIGAIANRSSASVLGSESTAKIALGAGVPVDQVVIVQGSEEYRFGEFTVTLRPSKHAPVGWRGSVPFAGDIAEPLILPQPVSAFRMGGAYSIVITHPQGTALVHGSAGFEKYDLRDVSADVVFLGVGQLQSLGREYAEIYWQNVVTASGGESIYPIHFDDYTQAFGEVRLAPKILDDFATTASWLEQFRKRWDTDSDLYLPEFGQPIAIFSQQSGD